ncbi:MAG: hypothetical protein AAGF85_19325 [Bacteroidota bacterium]
MNKYIRILGVIWVMAVMASCATANKEDVSKFTEEPLTEFNKSLTADMLNAANFKTYEAQAASKLIELYDYFAAISNADLDSASRQHIKRLALDLYYGTDPVTPFSGLSEPPADLDSFLNQLGSEEFVEHDFAVKSIDFIEGFSLAPDSLQYLGKVRYEVIVDGRSAGTSEIKVLIKKVEKQFGDEMEKVWDVLFY